MKEFTMIHMQSQLSRTANEIVKRHQAKTAKLNGTENSASTTNKYSNV